MALEEIFVTGATGFMKKLVSVAAKRIGKAGAIDKDLLKLKETLEMIAAVTSDAEEKQVKDKVVLLWLRRLQDVAYDADDLLDEISYQAMRGNMEKVTVQSKVKFGLKIADRIKTINHELDGIAKDSAMFQLEHSVDDLTEQLDRMTVSFVDDSKIVGRKDDKSRIVNMLLMTNLSSLSSSDNFSPQVISIVGMGGIGKTTLAQLVYKDDSIQRSFDLRAWVCISEHFNIFLILSKILESFTGEACHVSNIHVLVKEVDKKIRGKIYLLVLDDLWNEDAEDWEKLKGYLTGGAQGSKILITTRKENVACIVRDTIPPYILTTLSQQECWSIMKHRAFSPGGAVKTLTMSSIGEEISRKCGGLPLAAIFLGNLMRSKSRVSDWLAIRDNDVFNTPENPNKILLILKLSYDNLPSHLKKCFSYCCLFPKDYKFRRETLIRLWIAEGFIHPSYGGNRNSLENIGKDYFLCLLSNSFFQDVKRDDYLGDVVKFKMHDLVHDLALSVVGSHEVTTLSAGEMENNVSHTRRLRLATEGIPKNAKKLRTIVFQGGGFVSPSPPSLKHLRVLYRLVGADESMKTISSSAFKFKHMRYLDLSYYNLEYVHAESIHQLYNLQTLNLHCSENVQKILKEGIGSLINLTHLDLSSSDANLVPTMLTNLQTLNIRACGHIKVLPTNINHLQNLLSLDISHNSAITKLPDSISLLFNLTMFIFESCSSLNALPGNFGALTQLRSLDLFYTRITELPESLTSNICKLEFVNFGYLCKLPKDIKNWVELRILKHGKRKNSSTPRGIENLTRLEVLDPYIVRKEDDVSDINTCGYNSSIQELAHLNSLRRLVIENLENVRGGKVEAERAKFEDKKNIQDLELKWNYKEEEEEKNMRLAFADSDEEEEEDDERDEEEEECASNNSVMVLEGLQPHPSLDTLWISGFPGLKLPKWVGSSSCLANLVHLSFGNCKNCEKIVGLGQLPRLEVLNIFRMNSVKCLGEEFYFQQEGEEEESKEIKGSARRTLFPSLSVLHLTGLKNLEEWCAPQPPDNSFPCLERVEICECHNLTSIPDLRLWTSSLRGLRIRNCKKLEKEPTTNYLDKYLPSVRYEWVAQTSGISLVYSRIPGL